MKEDILEDIIRKAEDWRKQICACNQCYTSKASLIFPPFRQKIVLISESPFNFPNECKTLGDFLEKDFLESVRRKSGSIIPANIFDFLYRTFKPVFSDSPTTRDVGKFLRCVYWTHAAKKSLKDLSGNRREYAEKCSETTFRELKEIHPKLIVTASSVALHILFGRKYMESFGKQVEKVREHGKLLTVKELICEKEKPLLSRTCTFKDCEVAIFPNPSPTAAKWKKEAYGTEEIRTVLNCIHRTL